jgi:hypothetical protein
VVLNYNGQILSCLSYIQWVIYVVLLVYISWPADEVHLLFSFFVARRNVQ